MLGMIGGLGWQEIALMLVLVLLVVGLPVALVIVIVKLCAGKKPG